ncbi:hypothetical protein AFL94_08885 [Arthrobacter sp. LS16]|nr:hypothetical protein AFL94_08885 [Arthrobacter sp. LS16]
MTTNLDDLRKTVENAGEAWADGEHIDIITPPVVLELIERAEAAERALDFHSQRDRELKTLLSMIADRLDEFCYDELSSLIEDEPLDQWGETYKSRLEQAEQQVARVRALCVTTDGDPIDPDFDGNTVGDIRRALDGDWRG